MIPLARLIVNIFGTPRQGFRPGAPIVDGLVLRLDKSAAKQHVTLGRRGAR